MERTAGPFNVALVVAEESPDPVAGEGFCHVRELQHLRHHEKHDEATIRIDSDIALNLRNNGYGLRRDRGLRGQILNQRLQITPPGCKGILFSLRDFASKRTIWKAGDSRLQKLVLQQMALPDNLLVTRRGPESYSMNKNNEIRDMRNVAAQGEMEQRTLGETGEQVSAIGLGGFHLALPEVTEADAIRIVRTAVDRGITFMDNCWDYNEGESERRMGRALQNGYRDKVFLMTKFDGRTKESALKQLDESLGRLQVDYVDLWQFHENIRLEDPDRFFAQGGAVEAVHEAKAKGKIRYAGFTGHKDPLVHLRMLEVADERGFRWQTAQMPINVMDAHFRSFEKLVLPELTKRNMGALAMKSMGDGKILESQSVKPLECLQYALSRPVSVVITGIDRLELIDQAFEAVRSYQHLDAAQLGEILNRTAPLSNRGKFEPFKVDVTFDSTAKHQDWLGYPA